MWLGHAEPDPLYFEFRGVPVVETRDLHENTLLDLDAHGDICAMTVEHDVQAGRHAAILVGPCLGRIMLSATKR